MFTRKSFLKKATIATAGFSVLDWLKPAQAAELQFHLNRIQLLNPAEAAQDEDFWATIRKQYITSNNIINLNNGGLSPQPLPVQEAHINMYKYCNEAPSHYMWHILDKKREPLRQKLAELAGCTAEEIAFNRNTTEGLNTIIFGLNLKAGDEIALSKYDYPNMTNAWLQRQKRDGIKLNWVDLDLPEEDEETIVKKFEAAITPKTKIVHITHMLNWTGQILPARKIADMAHKYNCEVIVDGSHSFAHIEYKITELDCDYYATSLHKWLCAPFGTGFMFIKKEKIKNVWALLSAPIPDADNIGKFECIGTRSFPAEMAIDSAIDFQLMIGNQRKRERLQYLKNYWCNKIENLPGIKLYTSTMPEYACAIATFGIQGWKPLEIINKLFTDKKIHTTTAEHEEIKGVRVTPHVYTTLAELDQLVECITEMANTKPASNK